MPDTVDTLKAAGIAQAQALKEQSRQGGLRFDVYLPPDIAAWVLELIEKGVFHSPADAVFALVSESRDLHAFPDLREQLLGRMLQAAMDDPRPSLPAEEVFARLRATMAEPLLPAAEWKRSEDS